MLFGKPAKVEIVQRIQEIFLDCMNKELSRTALTFPVTTACFSVDRNKKVKDKEFLEMISKKNMEYGFINIYAGDTSTLSSCCFDGNQLVLTKSSNGIALKPIKEICKKENFELYRKNFGVFHNGSWVKAKPVILPRGNHTLYKITTVNNKEIIVTDNHLNLTDKGLLSTNELDSKCYLAFNNISLDSYPEKDLHLSYNQGFLIGAYAGDGSKYKRKNCDSYEVVFSFNENNKNDLKYLNNALKE